MKHDRLEEQIIHEIRRYKSDDILIALHSALKDLSDPKNIGHRFLPNGLPPFVTAGIASFAVRFSNPYRNAPAFGWPALASIASLVSQYLLDDPICFDTELAEKFNSENPSFVILRTFASQTLFEYNHYACFSQPLMMYGEIPKKIKDKKGIPYFDFHCEFEEAVGASLMDFTSICFIAVSAARGNTTGFTRGYFEKARQEGLRIPDDKTTLAILNSIAATPERFRKTYERMKVKDRRFRAYDFNPLMGFPIIRPWKDKDFLGMDSDRLIAPIPALIPYRASVGIYYEMFNKHMQTFSDWFGHIFEAYVGEILENSIYGPKLIGEDAIQKTYKKGKIPDYAVIDGSTLVVIDAKAVKFSRPALTTAAEEDIDDSLKQIIKGLRQLNEFGSAVIEKRQGLEDFHGCTEILSVIITHERLFLTNSTLFKDHVNNVYDKKFNDHSTKRFTWLILSVQELEILQPHLASGIDLVETIKKLIDAPYNEVVGHLEKTTGKTYKDSFLYLKDLGMFESLGLKISE